MSGFACMECGKKFRTVKAAMKAQDKGCSCGGFDIDLDVSSDFVAPRAPVILPPQELMTHRVLK